MIFDIGGGGHFADGQTGNAIAQHVVLVTPEKLMALVGMLVGSGLDAEAAVLVVGGLVARREFAAIE